ncbi:MAG: hypothetical protein RXO71_01955 [Nitrososphaeria archaeon]
MAGGTACGLSLDERSRWVTTSYEVMKMKAVNHEPMIRLKVTITF